MFSRRSCVLLAASLAVLTPMGRAHAQFIDQQNPATNASFGFAFTYYWTGQTFRPTATTSVGAGVWLENWNVETPQSGLLFMELWNQRPDLPSSTLVASGTTTFTTPVGDRVGTWVDVFWSAVNVTPGTEYFLGFRQDAPPRPNNAHGIVSTANSPSTYAGGQAYFNQSTDHFAPWFYNGINSDVSFREYAADVVAIPEPTSLFLFATGLIVLGVVVPTAAKRLRDLRS